MTKKTDTVSYAITVGSKVLQLANVPVAQNTTPFQAQIISIYSHVAVGEYTLEGSDITVTVSEAE